MEIILGFQNKYVEEKFLNELNLNNAEEAKDLLKRSKYQEVEDILKSSNLSFCFIYSDETLECDPLYCLISNEGNLIMDKENLIKTNKYQNVELKNNIDVINYIYKEAEDMCNDILLSISM